MMERMTTASATAILVNEEGLHVRPAAEFVALANSFESAITANGANGKGVLSLMAL
ncbi:MAG: HPr component phosphorylation site, partial [Glaciihabitans sp.]|nr:HPr component phosphorylation site [Glaciihabitans sp.]